MGELEEVFTGLSTQLNSSGRGSTEMSGTVVRCGLEMRSTVGGRGRFCGIGKGSYGCAHITHTIRKQAKRPGHGGSTPRESCVLISTWLPKDSCRCMRLEVSYPDPSFWESGLVRGASQRCVAMEQSATHGDVCSSFSTSFAKQPPRQVCQ